MKFSVQKETLLESLQKVQSVVEKKNTVQILSNVLLEVSGGNLILTATDLEVGIKLSTPVEMVNEGKVSVSAKNLFDIVKELPNKKVTFNKKENNWIEISCQKTNFNIVGLAADEYPPLPSFEGKNYFKVNTAIAKEMVDKILFSISTDETRYHLNGAFVEAIENNMVRMVSTDGHRLAFIDNELVLGSTDQLKRGIIIPKKGLNEMRKLLDAKAENFNMCVDKGNLLIQFEKTFLFVRLIEGEYPDYEQVIPKNNTKKMIINKEDFLGSLKRVSLLANEKSKGVKFSIKENLLFISSSNAELGDAKEELDVEYNLDEIDIGFNAKYIIEFLSAVDAEKMSVEFNDKLSPGIFRPVGRNDYTYIVMPMRI